MTTDDNGEGPTLIRRAHVTTDRQPAGAAGESEFRDAGRSTDRNGPLATIACALSLCFMAACADSPEDGRAAVAIEVPPVPRSMTIDVTAEDYRWHITYAGSDGVLGTADDARAMRDIHVPAHTQTVLRLHSRDFVYKLRLPHVRAAEIAVPEQEFTLEFYSGAPGEHELRGDQFCGFSHPDLIGTLHVQPHDEFAQWLSSAGASSRQARTNPQ